MKINFIFIYFCCICSFGCIAQESKENKKTNIELENTIQVKSYEILLNDIVVQKDIFKKKYSNIVSRNAKDSILIDISDYLVTILSDSLFPYWYGTSWDFSGTTQVPNEGAIACGYFVTTLLKHTGFNLERVRLAQRASELIIKSLTSEKYIKRFSNTPIKQFVEDIELIGDGLYVVGLDIHTGFILCNDDGVFFIHSSYEDPPLCVIKEIALDSNILSTLRYRVVGKIFDDHGLIEKWIMNEKIIT